VSANTDASALLRSTVQNLSDLKSATVDLKLAGEDGSAQVSGPFAVSDQEGELPRFALNATVKSGAKTESAGATWTGENGYATLDGVSYQVPGLIVRQLGAGLEQSSPLTALDVSKWVTNPRNAGAADVGGVETVKVTGGADIPAFLADVEKLTASLGSLQGMLGTGAGKLSLTPADRRQAAAAVKDARVDVYTGAEDSILRRFVFSATIDAKPVALDLTLTDVGEDVSISDVKGARPFTELASKFDRLLTK